MTLRGGNNRADFRDAVQGLENGDFSRLDPLFASDPTTGEPSQMMQWHEEGLFRDQPKALTEAFTCACFLGRANAAEYFLHQGVAPAGGASTGLNAFHWAVNRGEMEITRLLIGAIRVPSPSRATLPRRSVSVDTYDKMTRTCQA